MVNSVANWVKDKLGTKDQEAQKAIEESGIDYALIGTGAEVVQQLPYPDTPLFDEQQVILMTSGAATMPDLTYWSRNDAMKVA